VVLASGSPRRHDLLGRLGIVPVVRPPDVDVSARPGEAPGDLVVRLARSKAASVDAGADDLVVAADTVVSLGTRVLGKPADRREAAAMLASLSGREHHVLTGVAVRRGGAVHADVATTRVTFRELDDREIAWYVATGEADDKAGAYGLQGAGAVLVRELRGSDTNVIGLPLALLVTLARHVGVDLLRPAPEGPGVGRSTGSTRPGA
jgi:septum formation protein